VVGILSVSKIFPNANFCRIVIPPQANVPPATATGAQTTGNPVVITSTAGQTNTRIVQQENSL
jgi:hypothetical protein